MREIKFRGIREKTGEWVYGYLVMREEPFLHDIVSPIGNQSSCTWAIKRGSEGQYTGLKDKNGVEIYEGDIEQAENGDKNVIVFLLKAGTYCVMPMDIYLNNDYQNESFFPDFIYGFGYDLFFDNCTPDKYLNIIGNIYENPELLEG